MAAAAAVVVAALTTLQQISPARGAFGIPEFLEFGECSPIKPHANINFERYSGIWFNIEMVPNEYVEITQCAMTNYTWEGDLMLVEDRGLSTEGVKMRQGSLMYPTEGEPGVLTVEAEGVPSAPYVVVATDYDHYSCVHSCLAMMGFRAAFSWVLSRHPTPDPAHVALCHNTLQEVGVDISSLVPVTQGKECPYTNKLDAVLAYSARVQAKAEEREAAMHKGKVASTPPAAQTVTDHRHHEVLTGAGGGWGSRDKKKTK
ncbi:Crustacyanin-A2 subunit [Chionoecetes opilio]|uniref:Crustacyanin-A2 subunit n=1 Tax=Chionoecetes opilio TaxID=41210 RepID=A0A8J5CPP6_CHIOP|nr:Crustacyanin-A2 subunit [Chionoecetes opilio]